MAADAQWTNLLSAAELYDALHPEMMLTVVNCCRLSAELNNQQSQTPDGASVMQ